MAKQVTKKWTENDVAGMVAKKFPSPAYAFLTQVRNGTGHERRRNRTAYAVAVSCYPSRGLYAVGIEIKVSKSDWRKELADPQKSSDIQQYCRYWYVAAPKGIVPLGEVPDNWGLIECDRSSKIVKAAPRLEEKPMDTLMACSVIRNCNKIMVPAAEVQQRVRERLEEVRANERSLVQREISELQATISAFEEASGVSLAKRWDSGYIGRAVKFIRECGVDGALGTMRDIRDDHQRLADAIAARLEEYEK